MKRLLSTLSQKWPEYLLEVLVITMGILAAFALNNWNDQRKLRNREIQMLTNIQSGLKSDLVDLKDNNQGQRSLRSSQHFILDFLDGQFDHHDSLDWHFGHLYQYSTFLANEGAFETLNSIGKDIISNDSLLSEINDLYDARYDWYKRNEQLFSKYCEEYVSDHASRHFNNLSNSMTPLSIEKIRADQQYRFSVSTLRAINNLHIGSITRTIRAVENLIAAIDKEIARLKNE